MLRRFESQRVFGRKGMILRRVGALAFLIVSAWSLAAATAQRNRPVRGEDEFGPVVRAYLGYLRAQQEVVDDRVSRREVSADYYRRNSDRIRALRQMAISIARETGNDYLPELEAVATDELETLFETPPSLDLLRAGETLNDTFRYLGAVRMRRDRFYLFARLDPYEQEELRKQAGSKSQPRDQSPTNSLSGEPTSRPRRVGSP